MGIPKKGSRTVEYTHASGNVQTFRFIVKEGHIPDHPDQKDITVTIQEDGESPGRVLQCRLPYRQEVSPGYVKELIKDGFQLGWDPKERGGAFTLT